MLGNGTVALPPRCWLMRQAGGVGAGYAHVYGLNQGHGRGGHIWRLATVPL